ncbi:hypothetical protein [Alkalihalobacillus pseudalcaliphilus]|uniref:hypothetical protein n=1 Tax=Alkalihalobacillus pseudalcaliphilus TaxID=79884 RepID=UPI00235DEC4E|nr:hypothetical protein [Alkalihalobacillus pseudalcaliphilus]
MNLYKAHAVHPQTDVPLIIYFNKRDGYVTFAKDEEVIHILKSIREDLWENQRFLAGLDNVERLCHTQYPVSNFKEMIEFLQSVGFNKDDLEFKQMVLH